MKHYLGDMFNEAPILLDEELMDLDDELANGILNLSALDISWGSSAAIVLFNVFTPFDDITIFIVPLVS